MGPTARLGDGLTWDKQGDLYVSEYMLAGRVVENGDASLAHELHDQGYAGVRARHPDVAAEELAYQQVLIGRVRGHVFARRRRMTVSAAVSAARYI